MDDDDLMLLDDVICMSVAWFCLLTWLDLTLPTPLVGFGSRFPIIRAKEDLIRGLISGYRRDVRRGLECEEWKTWVIFWLCFLTRCY